MRPNRALHGLLGILVLYVQSLCAETEVDKFHKMEDEFIAAVQSFADKDSNEKTIGARKDALKKVLGGYEVRAWAGVVSEVKQLEHGEYALALTIGDAIVLRSGGGGELEGVGTLIPADSPLCEQLSQMQPGQKVNFAGAFLRDNTKGPNKKGLLGNGSLQQPEFAFQLLRIRKPKPPPEKSWPQIVAETRNQILTLHQAGGGKLNLLEFARSMKFKMNEETEAILKDRGDLVFEATGENFGTFTNEGTATEIKPKVGHIEIPRVLSGTYDCRPEKTVLRFAKNQTFNGKLAVISAPLESVTADEQNVVVKIGGIMGGALSRTLPVK